MAITSRAARTTDLGSGSTPAVVGPGSYLKVEREMPVHGYAPFSSTAERSLGVKAEAPDAKVRHPGPGQYDLKRTGHISNGKRAAGSAFSSKVARMTGTADSSLPGPGQYTLPSQWGGGSSKGGGASAKEARRGVAYLRVPSAPSVPSREQSYGYEETHTGELVLQKPPAGGYSGVSGRLSAGPGSYDPTRATSVTKPQSKAVAWGNSRVQRSVFLQGSDTPGPGTYNGRPPPSESSDPATAARSARPSAAFSSRVPLAHQLAHDPDRVMPGPASYSPMVGLQPKSMPENLQTFGSTQKRLASDAVTTTERQRMAQPGPGAYNTAGTFGKKRAEKPPQSAPGAPGLSPFNTSEQRFKPLVKEGKPGPGQYDQLDQYTFVADLQRKTHGRNGVFGSTTRRFHTLKQDPIPGAGAYDPVPVSATQQSDEPTSSFASGQERFAKTAPATLSGKAPKDPVPPPWHYVIKTENSWDKRSSSSRKANQIFGSTATRFADSSSARGGPVPGPGSYAPRYPNEGYRKQQTTAECFGTKQARFGAAAGFAAHTPSPGPGDYESGIDSINPLVKRSFNITVS